MERGKQPGGRHGMRIHIPLVLGMYVLIYNPPVLGFNWIWIVMPLSVLYVLLHWKELKSFTNLHTILWTEVVLGVMLVYLAGMAVLNHHAPSAFGYFVYWMAGDIPFALAAWICLRKRGQGFSGLIDHLLTAGLVMAATAIASLTIPAVKIFFTERMNDYGIPYVIKFAPYRNYGFAANLVSTAAYAQGVLACIALYRGMKGKPVWLAAFPMLAFSANINARTAIAVILAGIAAAGASVLYSRDRKKIFLYAGIAATSFATAFFGLQLVQYMSRATFEWLTRGLDQVGSFVAGGEDSGYFTDLAGMSGISNLPQGLKLVFGAGTGVLYGSEYGVASDVGFLNDLWRGGILYSAAIIGLFLRTLWQILRSRTVNRQDGVFLAVLFLLVFGFTNIKGSFFIHSDVTAIFWMLMPAAVWNRETRQGESLLEGM